MSEQGLIKAVQTVRMTLDGKQPPPPDAPTVAGLLRLCLIMLEDHDDPLDLLQAIEDAATLREFC